MAGPAQEAAEAGTAPEPAVTQRAGADTPRPARLTRLLWAAAFTAAAIALFAVYLRLSNTYPENSDQANLGLQAHDMLHGNPLLHGWVLSDVSFYTTELPQYMLLELILGLSTGTFHAAAAMTYTLALLLAALLAKGRARGRRGVLRALIAGGIMLVPQLGAGVFDLLLTVGHIGTVVPVLAVWLILDRAPRRWYVPVIAGIILAWVTVADSLVLVAAIAPLTLVSVARAIWRLGPGDKPGPGDRPDPVEKPGPAARLRSAWYELSLAGAAIAGAGVSRLAERAIHAAGGYTVHQVPFRLAAPGTLGAHALTTGDSLLTLFGANFGGLRSPAAVAFAVLHLTGLVLVAWALGRTLRRFTSCGLIDQVLAVAIVLAVAAYLFSSFSSGVLNAREIAQVLPFGAALAARSLVPRIREVRRRRRAGRAGTVLAGTVLAGTVLAGYAASLGYELAQPVSPPANARLASWLQAHHLAHGLSGYWQASAVTVDSGGRVTIRAVTAVGGGIGPYPWETKTSWYNPRAGYASFVVLQDEPGFFNQWQPASEVRATFGAPDRTFRTGPYTVLVWKHNLLDDMRG
jgi:hypothetical protein